MKYSILTPTLNEENFIGKLLEALCDQDFKDFEVVVVDGNSEDKTVEVINSFKDRLEIRTFEHEGRGVGIQRNFAAQNARAENLIFFDADVIPTNDFLLRVDQVINTEKPDTLTSWNWPISDKFIDKVIFFILGLHLEAIKKLHPGAYGTFIFSTKKVFEDLNGFDEEAKIDEDFDYIYRAFKKGYKFKLLRDPKINVSVRRLEKIGRFKMAIKVFFIYSSYLLRGPIKDDKGILKYEFGNFK